ncbi:hypothetical protein, partial [Marinobacter sp.]|uniref:hypothetical protein n=1 Tax=Marinobacter sp. TaxID=50741 RepID=UPI00329A1941
FIRNGGGKFRFAHQVLLFVVFGHWPTDATPSADQSYSGLRANVQTGNWNAFETPFPFAGCVS